jgi:hypothetical protein
MAADAGDNDHTCAMSTMSYLFLDFDVVLDSDKVSRTCHCGHSASRLLAFYEVGFVSAAPRHECIEFFNTIGCKRTPVALPDNDSDTVKCVADA